MGDHPPYLRPHGVTPPATRACGETSMESNNSKPTANLFQTIQSVLQLFPGMGRGDDRSDTRLRLRYRRVSNARSKDSFLKQLIRKVHREVTFSHYDWSDGSFACTCIEASTDQAVFEKPGVFPQAIY